MARSNPCSGQCLCSQAAPSLSSRTSSASTSTSGRSEHRALHLRNSRPEWFREAAEPGSFWFFKDRAASTALTRPKYSMYDGPGPGNDVEGGVTLVLGGLPAVPYTSLGWCRRGTPATRKHEHGGGDRKDADLQATRRMQRRRCGRRQDP